LEVMKESIISRHGFLFYGSEIISRVILLLVKRKCNKRRLCLLLGILLTLIVTVGKAQEFC
jgi:hypothetical protein